MTTDTERLDWLDSAGDMGRIDIDPDLEGTPRFGWNHFIEDEVFPNNVRDAIDAAIKKYAEQEAQIAKL